MFNKPNPRQNFSDLENEINKWWKNNNIFEKTVKNREGAQEYIFYDGPPFMSGMPHYATLLSSLPKDAVPRFQTMRGKKVERVWGWDCHGLPIENKVEEEMGITDRSQIEENLDAFIQKCYEWNRVGIENWRWYIEKIGRWADLDNAYRTLDQDYMESIWWVFKTIWDKGLIYKGLRTSLFSTDSSTPVSSFEVSMDPDNYRDTEDLAVYIKFELTLDSIKKLNLQGKKVYLVAWTTTPWTLPSNFALAINPKAKYSVIEVNAEILILIKQKVAEALNGFEYTLVGEISGDKLSGLDYIQLLDYLPGNENDFKVYTSDYVDAEEGSGVLHIAPAFGEEDFNLGQLHNLSFTSDIDDSGNLVVGPWKGMYLRDANKHIAEFLSQKGNLLRMHTYTHRLPYYRYNNPLIYKTQENYFINIQKIKAHLIESNENINWVPEHFKKGRFENVLKTAPDWSISRSRFWGTPMPIWEADDGSQVVVGSRDELAALVNSSKSKDKIQKVILSLNIYDKRSESEVTKELLSFIDSNEKVIEIKTNQKILSKLRKNYLGETNNESVNKLLKEKENRFYYLFNGNALDLHRPYIDQVTFDIKGKLYKRVKDTLDVWMDSGSMPFAQFHYPFENKTKFEHSFPGDFIAEYTGQIRAWFYVLHAISYAAFENNAFKNVLVTGVLAGTDGRKMSKSFGNYPDPKDTLEKYGGEALRLYFLGSTLLEGNDMNFSEQDLKKQVREFILPIWNIYSFLTTYANIHEWQPRSELCYNKRNQADDTHPWDHIPFDEFNNSLDAWITTKLQQIEQKVVSSMEAYTIPAALRSIKDFMNDLSKWYIRRSRDRFNSGETRAIEVLYYVFVELLKLMAPFTPFLSEYIYKQIVADMLNDMPESIHLCDYPLADENFFENNSSIIAEMGIVQKICEMGHAIRAEKGIKVRQPLEVLEVEIMNEQVPTISEWMEEIICSELNLKRVQEVVKITQKPSISVQEDTSIKVKIGLETEISDTLMQEGLFRELARTIQSLRKQNGFNIGEKVDVEYDTFSNELEAIFSLKQKDLKNAVGADKISKVSLKLDKSAILTKVNNLELTVKLSKVG